jgi:tetratricopeptide (TPR) repeat protein
MGLVRSVSVIAVLIGLGAAGVSSIRYGWADYQMGRETVVATEGAIALTPTRAEYSARLAWLESESHPEKAKQALWRAVALNPRDAKSWIELGLRAEQENNSKAAQEYLLRAAEADKTFLPRWTLANYYLRQEDPARFWVWAKEAAAMMYGDGASLFQLCGRVEEDGNLIDRLDIRNPETRSSYLAYLIGKKRVDLIGPSVRRVLEANRPADLPLLMQACDRLLAADRVDQAAEIWNELADQGRVAFRTSAGEGQQLMANASFIAAPSSQGFDWRLPLVEGLSASLDGSRGLRITLSGREPEDCEMLDQLVPVRPKQQYQLKFQYRTSGIAKGSGLRWQVTDANSGVALGEGPILESEEDTEGRLSFETTGATRVRLALRYRRMPGTTRSEGFIVLRKVELHPGGRLPVAQFPMEGSRVKR